MNAPLSDLRLPITAVATTLGMTPSALRNWLKRHGMIGGEEGVEGGGQHGREHLFSFANVMELAIARELIRDGNALGIQLRTALRAGATFAYTGNSSLGGMQTVNRGDPYWPARLPAFPYFDSQQPDLRTLAFVSHRGCAVLAWGEGLDPLSALRESQGLPFGALPPTAMVDCGELFFQICRTLDYRPLVEIERAYAEARAPQAE